MRKVFCIGECLIDMIPASFGSPEYTARTGGAPANVCACAARLGADAYYIGRLSTDGFAQIISESLEKCGVNTEYAVRDSHAKTAVALVELSKSGDRSFRFLRDGTADLMLCEDDIKDGCFADGDLLHFCSVGLVESPSKYAHIKALKLANKNNAKVSFDVNLRPDLYKDNDTCTKTVAEFLPFADIVKVTDEELEFITDMHDEVVAVKRLFEMAPKAKILFITKGENGACVYDRSLNRIEAPAKETRVVDTTGAGDCFCGSMLYRIATGGFYERASDYAEYLDFCLSACAKVCSRYGAMEAMPYLSELQ